MMLIQLDGSTGGGQMLRTALSLSMITGQPFRMVNIRGQRSKPGLMRQHLTCVRAATEISNGSASGAEIGSTELVFSGGEVTGGDYHYAIGTAGSTTLLMQTLLPALWQADVEANLTLEGGTHNPMAPSFDFIERVFLPAMERFGARTSVELHETGFAPAGGGKIGCGVQRCSTVKTGTRFVPASFLERGDEVSRTFRILHRNLPEDVPAKLQRSAKKDWPGVEVVIDDRGAEGPGRGALCLAEVELENHREMFAAHGEQGVRSEHVVRKAVKAAKGYLGSGVGVSNHLADQLLLPMALAGGGEFTTLRYSNHIKTNIAIIEAFLPVRFAVDDSGPVTVSLA